LLIDDTLCEHVGSLFEYVDRHYNHGEGSYPLAHNLVTSHYVSGAVRFPVAAPLYRRYEETTQWADFVQKHFPAETIPTQKKQRTAFHQRIDPLLLADPAFRTLHEQFCTKIALATELVKDAIAHDLAFQWTLFDGWYLSPEFLAVIEQQGKDWISILKNNRNLETKKSAGTRAIAAAGQASAQAEYDLDGEGVQIGESNIFCVEAKVLGRAAHSY
jgi:hypothetical protein